MYITLLSHKSWELSLQIKDVWMKEVAHRPEWLYKVVHIEQIGPPLSGTEVTFRGIPEGSIPQVWEERSKDAHNNQVGRT